METTQSCGDGVIGVCKLQGCASHTESFYPVALYVLVVVFQDIS
jgi:hypothetical protein